MSDTTCICYVVPTAPGDDDPAASSAIPTSVSFTPRFVSV